jgi:hypothetical protein
MHMGTWTAELHSKLAFKRMHAQLSQHGRVNSRVEQQAGVHNACMRSCSFKRCCSK